MTGYMGVYLALAARVRINLESLNMAESVGNVTKHRKAPVIVESGGAYRLVYVPVVSGMSLSHHYQLLLARAAKARGLPVTAMSLQGYFLKFADDKIIANHYPEVAGKVSKKNDPCTNERILVESCTVGDVGGFLYTDGGVKRNSRFSFSYMMPALDALGTGGAGVVPQLHVRYSPTAKEGEQALIYIENSSALYTFSYVLEASEISKLNVCNALGKKPDDLGADARRGRFRAAIEALTAMVGNMAFGAKRSRSLPHWTIESLVVVASKGIAPLTPTPGHSKDYLASTVARAKTQAGIIRGLEYSIHYYAREKLEETTEAKRHTTPEDAIRAAAEWAEKLLR